jgi:hypothetical protein
MILSTASLTPTSTCLSTMLHHTKPKADSTIPPDHRTLAPSFTLRVSSRIIGRISGTKNAATSLSVRTAMAAAATSGNPALWLIDGVYGAIADEPPGT